MKTENSLIRKIYKNKPAQPSAAANPRHASLAEPYVEPVEKPLSAYHRGFEGGFEVPLDPSLLEKIDCDAFQEVTFFGIPKSLFSEGFSTGSLTA
jgi:hypothetical protein